MKPTISMVRNDIGEKYYVVTNRSGGVTIITRNSAIANLYYNESYNVPDDFTPAVYDKDGNIIRGS